jgi:hypothetical protein
VKTFAPQRKKRTRLLHCFQNARYLQLGYESLRLLIADQPAVFELPSHCTKDIYTRQGSTHDLWTVGMLWTALPPDTGLYNVTYFIKIHINTCLLFLLRLYICLSTRHPTKLCMHFDSLILATCPAYRNVLVYVILTINCGTYK